MKKVFLAAGFAVVMTLASSAQSKRKAPPPPPPPVPAVEAAPAPPANEFLSDDYETFLKKNPSVRSLGWNAKNEVIVHLKSGKEERYLLNSEGRRQAEAKYGALPEAPPPPPKAPLPPPPPPAPPAPPVPTKNGEEITFHHPIFPSVLLFK